MTRIVLGALFALLTVQPVMAEGGAIAALISDTSNPYWKTFEDGLRDTARSEQSQVEIYTLQNATDAEGQLNECEAAILKAPKAMLFAAVNGMNLSSCLKKAHERGIALIDVDGNVDEKLAERMGVPVAFSVASNNYDLGVKAGEYLKGRKGKALIIEGLSGSQPNELRVKGFKDAAAGSFEIVASLPAEWDRMKAGDITSRIILKHPDLGYIFAANDTMALGAVEALRAAGKSGVQVIGIDGSSDAVKAIKEGRLTASVAQLPYLMAKEALEKAVRFIRDPAPVEFHQFVPIVVLDRAAFSKPENPLLQYLR